MPLLDSPAILLHAAPYLESSLLLRLLTREAGVVSAVARGARGSKRRFGSGLDLFAEGQAQLQVKEGRDLHTLTGFDVTAAHPALAADLGRFTAAAAIAECVLRLVHEEAALAVYDRTVEGVRRLERAAPDTVGATALAALWQIVAEVGYRPTLRRCAECHAPIDPAGEARFHVAAGGTLCDLCAPRVPGGRRLPAEVRGTLAAWLGGDEGAVAMDAAMLRAHQRLLREFLAHHLPDRRPLSAYTVWERGNWG